MPVLVHAAHRTLGRALTRRLLEEGGQVRATARDGVALLRAEGIFTAACDPDDEGILEAALTQVHTLVVLLGGLGRADVDAVRREGLVAARAADGAAVERVILVTLAGGAEDAADPLRRAHGVVASAFAELPLPSIELRTGLVTTAAAADLLLAAGLPAEVRAQRVAPVVAEDLLELIVAVDRARSRAESGHLVVAVDGRTRCTLEDHLAMHASRAPESGRARLTGRRVPSPDARDMLITTLAGPWWTEDPEIPDARDLFDVAPAAPAAPAAPSVPDAG
jgi:uncharacterized protein YbjT (DUF2867 family)